ncbi:hypothetical protein [Yersinia nurmii]|nr:hypothetical protein [Yersinia nurmii]
MGKYALRKITSMACRLKETGFGHFNLSVTHHWIEVVSQRLNQMLSASFD